VAACLAAEASQLSQLSVQSNRKLMAGNSTSSSRNTTAPALASAPAANTSGNAAAQASEASFFFDTNPSQCTKLKNEKKDKCPRGQELACCDADPDTKETSCFKIKDADSIAAGLGDVAKAVCAAKLPGVNTYKACCKMPDKKADKKTAKKP
jgi:hypothetical protein